MPESIEDIKKENVRLKKENEKLEAKLRLYQQPSDLRSYYSLNRMINAQVDVLEEFDLGEEIKKNPKDDKVYDRVKSIWEGLSALTKEVNSLQPLVGATGDEEKDIQKKASFMDKMITST